MADVQRVPTTRVPVEHRWFGLDRRSFPPALLVVAVFLVSTVVVPRINAAIAWDDPVRAGDQLLLTGDVAFVPATGWNVVRGFRLGEGGLGVTSGEATVVGDGVAFDIVPDSFDGTPAALLRQVGKVTAATGDQSFQVDNDPTTVTTGDGDVGVIQTYSSIGGDGVIAAFVIDGTGLKVTAYGPPAQMNAAADDIGAMITSIRTVDADGSAS